MNGMQESIRDFDGERQGPRRGSAAASGSAAYQSISGRLWSSASSAWLSSPARMAQPLVERQPLQGRGEVEPHDGRRVVAGQLRRTCVEQRFRATALPSSHGELDRPGAHVRARRRRASYRPRSRSSPPRDVQGPEAAQPTRVVGMLRKQSSPVASSAPRRVELPALGLEQPPGVAHVPVVLDAAAARPALRVGGFARSTFTGLRSCHKRS